MDNSSWTFVDGLIASNTGPSFQSSCLQNLRLAKPNDPPIELVNQWGQRVSTISNDTWGISSATCSAYCSSGQVQYPFNYGQFANAMTNYLLPWLALTAQLPYETGDPWANVMAFCMAVGSPVLITYSLTLTILNRSWARKHFGELKTKAMVDTVRRRAPDFDRKVSAMQFFVQESQQTPVRTNSERHWLASLIVLPRNIDWWERLENRLKGTRRGFSPSLVAQMSLAVTAYLLTVIAAFVTSLGDPNTALQLASGSLWIWLVPVILGWVTVGTQITDHAISDALRGNPAWRARDPPLDVPATPYDHRGSLREDGDAYAETGDQKGIECRGGLSPQALAGRDAATAAGAVQWSDITNLQVQGWLGFAVGGDEEIKGPTFNYARLFTWWQVTTTLSRATFATLDKISQGRACGLSFITSTAPMDWSSEQSRFLSDSNAVAAYCGLSGAGSNKQYPGWRELPAQVYRRMLAAAFAAVFVQWGTAGDSIMTAYMTPTVGLGCRSGSYLLYAGASTLAWLLLVIGMLFSHQAMLLYQERIVEQPSTNFGASSDPNDPKRYERTSKHTLYCALAVIFRVLGKGLCILNTAWLLLTSIMELVGAFYNCWCLGIYPSKREYGYIVLFKGAKDLAQTASVYWGGGLAMTLLVVVFAVGFFALGTWKPDTD